MNKEELKDFKSKKKRNMLVKTGIVVIALTLTFIFDRFEKNKFDEATGQKGEDAISALGDLLKIEPVEKSDNDLKEKAVSPKIDDLTDKDSSAEDLGKVEEDDNLKKASQSISDSYREHGKNAVLKSVDELTESELKVGGYPIVEPDFNNLHPINYRGLKKVYTYFRIRESLPDVVVNQLNGAAVVMTGAVMPVAEIPEDGTFQAFWLSNPSIVLAGCVFCSPPTLADIVYVYKDGGEVPFKVDREKLFKQVVLVRVVGRLFFGPEKRGDQVFLFSIQSSDIKILN